jgi:hypothetical protein
MTRSGSVAEPPRAAGPSRLTEDELMTAVPARSANREVKVGAFVLVGLAMFLTALFTLTDVGMFRGRYYATTVIEDAGGMRRGDPVQMRGVNIGRVTGFNMVPDGVSVRMELYNDYVVPSDSRVLVRSSGLLGGMVVEVVPGVSERAGEGIALPGSVEAGLMKPPLRGRGPRGSGSGSHGAPPLRAERGDGGAERDGAAGAPRRADRAGRAAAPGAGGAHRAASAAPRRGWSASPRVPNWSGRWCSSTRSPPASIAPR